MKRRTIFLAILAVMGLFYAHYHRASAPSTASDTRKNQSDNSSISGVGELRKNSQQLLVIVDKQDPYTALQELQRRMDTNPVVFKNCHELAHEIGHEAIKRYKDLGTALKYTDTTCSDGYLHGIIEQTFGDQTGNITGLIKQMQTLCNGLQGLAQRCFHGVGHAMMFYTNNDLSQALRLCRTLIDTTARGRCFEGAYMQNFLADPDLHPSEHVNYQNPMQPCQAAAAAYKPYCYFYVPIFYLNQNNNDYAKGLQWCETDRTGFAGTCARGIGSLIAKYNIKDPKFGQNLCSASPHVSDCVAGIVSYGLTFYASGQKVFNLMCNQMDEPYKGMCTKDLNEKVNLF